MGLLYLYLLTLEYGVKVQMIIHKQSNVGEI